MTQKALVTAAVVYALAAAAAFLSGGPFARFFSIFLVASAVVTGACAVVWSRGRRRAAGVTLIAFGGFLALCGFALFAPQPILVSQCSIALGVVILAT